MWLRLNACCSFLEWNRLPLSECRTQPAIVCSSSRCPIVASSKAATTSRASFASRSSSLRSRPENIALTASAVWFSEMSVRHPFLRPVDGQRTPHEIVMDQQTGTFALATAAVSRTPTITASSRPIRYGCCFGNWFLSGVPGLVDQTPVAELRIVTVGAEQQCSHCGTRSIGISHRTDTPSVVELAGKLQPPNTGLPVGGKLAHE